MVNKNIEAIYPLSPMQQGMLFHAIYEPEEDIYFERFRCTLDGPLDVDAFQRAWQQVVDRHPALRTAFTWKGKDQPLQVVFKSLPLTWDVRDWRDVPESECGQRIEALLEADLARGLDLMHPPLMRMTLIRRDEALYDFLWSHHHIIIDGWCMPIVLREAFTFYEFFRRGETTELPPSRPYRDYIAWLQKQDLTQAERFWRETLAGFSAPTSLVETLAPRSEPARPGHCELGLQLAAETTEALAALARRHQITLSTVLQGAWALLLARYAREEDVVFGVTVSGRPPELEGVESIVGLFINTLPLRVAVDPDARLGPWLKRIQERQVEMREYEYSPLVQVQGWSEAPRGMSLFDTLLVFENYPLGATLEDSGISLDIRDVHASERTNYAITVVGCPGEVLDLRLIYDALRFDAATARRMLAHLKTLLEGFAASSDATLGEFSLLTKAERQAILHEWNTTDVHYPQDATLPELFAAQVERTSDAPAVTFEAQRLTYAELNARANRLAHRLRALGVERGDRVGLYMERSEMMIVAMLGVLKAGGAYLPMDTAYPAERLGFMIEDATPPVVISQTALAASLPEMDAELLLIDEQADADVPETDPAPVAMPGDVAYVIYTSGSTGKPKGVQVTHDNVVRLFRATEHWYHFSKDDVWSMFHSYAFDMSVWEMWGALLYGGRLVVIPYWISRSPQDFYRMMSDEGVTFLNQTPSVFRHLVQAESEMDDVPALNLRAITFGGEALDFPSLRPWFERHGDTRPQLVNMYGITEITVHATYRPVNWEDVSAGRGSLIGVPVPDLQIYLMDPQQNLVPVGVPGEICVGGAGVARGYLNRPELNAARFVPDPFRDDPDARIYRSGDLARYTPDGDLEYLGRIDHQVKIRGFRVELGEIETLLEELPEVHQAVVLVREDGAGEQRLVAYLVPAEEEIPALDYLRSSLKARLPVYMVPAAFVMLDAIPLTTNGKVDRRSLPAPGGEALAPDREHVPPRSPLEKKLAQIWAALLPVEAPGIHDNFFDLGGHSLIAVQMISRVRSVWGVDLPIRTIFETPTIAQIAAAVDALREAAEKSEATAADTIQPVSRSARRVKLTSLQKSDEANEKG